MKYLTIPIFLLVSTLSNASITIEGTVTDKNGNPVSKCDVFINAEKWTATHDYHVQCDANGHYEVEIEEGHYNSIYVCDEDKYGKTALEFWGWNLDLYEDQTIDAAFDTLEVFSLSAWASNGGSNSIFASFRPMSLKQPTYRNENTSGEKLAILDMAPSLNSDSIIGALDGVALELLHFNWTYELITPCNGFPATVDTEAGCYMPMIIAQFKKPDLQQGQHVLKIRLEDFETGNVGEGITHFTSNQSGYGF